MILLWSESLAKVTFLKAMLMQMTQQHRLLKCFRRINFLHLMNNFWGQDETAQNNEGIATPITSFERETPLKLTQK